MAAADQFTIQHGIRQAEVKNITDYALFMGGTNVTHEVLQCYDPLRTGYGRIFMVRKPRFLDESMPTKLNNFKHILEYGNTSIQGLGDVSVNFDSITGGYVGKAFEIPTNVSDGTNTITITVYEFSGSPVREVLHSWINGTIDLQSGFSHYNGVSVEDVPRLMANQTAEFIYVNTDVTGEEVEYACLLANAFPENINIDAFNYTAGTHGLVETAIPFHCVKYESIQINRVAKALITKYKLLANSLNFFSGYNSNDANLGYSTGFGYNVETGKLDPAMAGKDTNTPVVNLNN